jgi:exodeoxyribonuclease VII small subunit
MAKKVQTPQTPPKSFEEALRELEQILSEIEGGEMGLEESLLKYERGNFLIQHCRGVLNNAEKQIDLLGKSPDGGLSSTPYPLPPTEAVVADRHDRADRAAARGAGTAAGDGAGEEDEGEADDAEESAESDVR